MYARMEVVTLPRLSHACSPDLGSVSIDHVDGVKAAMSKLMAVSVHPTILFSKHQYRFT